MQDVLGRDRLLADTRFGKRDVLRDRRVEVVAHHQHVQMLGDRVDRIGPRRIGGRRQHVRFAADFDDVRRMAAAGAFGVEGVDGAAFESLDRVLDETRFVQRVGVDGDLHVHRIGHRETVVDGSRGRAPVFVELEPHGARAYLLFQRLRQARVAFAEEAEIHRKSFRRAQHRVDVPRAGRARGRKGARRRTRAAAEHRRDAARERFLDLLRADPVDVRVDAAGRDDHAFAGDHFGAGADRDRDAGLYIGIARLADLPDVAVLQADVRLDDAPVIDDQRVGDHGVGDVSALRWLCPMPSRITLPPPNFTSSP